MTSSSVPLRDEDARNSGDDAINAAESDPESRQVVEQRVERTGRYTLDALIGVGGMASVYLGCSSGAADFSRIVAVKRMHPQYARAPAFVSRFRDEAWLCARLLHPNIVQTLDVVESNSELLLVMEYVEGVTLQALRTDTRVAGQRVPLSIAVGILVPALHGLHAAHEAKDDAGQPLGLVHRDFTPHNILISREGHAKVLDFGIAKARGQLHETTAGQLSGKSGYLSPEQINLGDVDRRADVFAAGIVLWELLTGQRLFRERGLSDATVLQRVLDMEISPPSTLNPELSPNLDALVMKALMREPAMRFESAREFALALEVEVTPATPSKIEDFVARVSSARLAHLANLHCMMRQRAQEESPPCAEPGGAALEVPALVDHEHIRERRPATRRWWLAALASVTVAGAAYTLRPSPPVRAAPSVAAHAARTAEVVGWQSKESPAPNRAALTVSPPPTPPAIIASWAPPNSTPPLVVGKPLKPSGRRTAAIFPRSVAFSAAADSPAAKDGCSPPIYLDSEGIRHFKDQCL